MMVHANEVSNGEADDQSYSSVNNSEDLLPHNATSIGREFVRQYYTMLCNGPNYMHRFYTNDSLFVRDGKVLIGQSSIEMYGKEVQQKDTLAKIRAIDAHATINKGVLVQVVGEVSSNNEPFRFFVQTFVLAPHKTPKRYYVHNDTFRFLDELLTSSNLGTSELNTMNENMSDPEQISPNCLADCGTNNGHPYGDDITVAVDSTSCSYQSTNCIPYHDSHSASLSRSECTNFAQQQSSSGDSASVASVPDLVRDVRSSCDQEETQLYDTGNNGCHVSSSANKESVGVGTEEINEQEASMNSKQTATWARVASKNANTVLVIQPSSFNGNMQPVGGVSPNQAMGNMKQSCLENYKPVNLAIPTNIGPGGVVPRQYDVRASQNPVHGLNGHSRVNSLRYQQRDHPSVNRDLKDFQVFVGNLPAESKEEEIRSLFVHYGNVTQVSIVSKQSQPPFAFVTFDSVESVKRTVDSASELFVGKNKLSVERKRGQDQRFQQNSLNRGDMNNCQRNNLNSRGGGGISRPPFHHRSNGPFSRGGGGGSGRTFNNRQSGPMGGGHVQGFVVPNSVQK